MSKRTSPGETGRVLWVTTSWDDGYPLDLRLAALLDRYQIPATFYVPVRSRMSLLSPGQIRELSKVFEVGGHTVNHLQLDAVSPECGRKEIIESKQWLEDLTGKPCHMFCPPGGRFRRANLAHVREAGYWGIRTVELMSTESPALRDDLVLLPTTLQLYHHHASTYLKNASKRGRWKNFQNYCSLVRGSDLVQATDAILEKLLSSGGMLHIWGHSWELEHSRLWDTLETILKRLDAQRERCRFVTNSELCQIIKAASPSAASYGAVACEPSPRQAQLR